jgi:hypothetical protein
MIIIIRIDVLNMLKMDLSFAHNSDENFNKMETWLDCYIICNETPCWWFTWEGYNQLHTVFQAPIFVESIPDCNTLFFSINYVTILTSPVNNNMTSFGLADVKCLFHGTYCIHLLPRRWKQHFHSKRLRTCIRVHDVKFQTTVSSRSGPWEPCI